MVFAGFLFCVLLSLLYQLSRVVWARCLAERWLELTLSFSPNQYPRGAILSIIIYEEEADIPKQSTRKVDRACAGLACS